MKTEFVPMTGNTQELQYRPSPSQKWFLAMMHKTQSDDLNRQMKSSKDPQGMYIAGPDGKSYGFTNDHYPDDVHKFMNSCLSKYRSDPPAKVNVTQNDLKSTFSVKPPDDAFVARVFSRIWPLPDKCWGLNRGVGRDYFWIYKNEIQSLLASSKSVGQSFALPQTVSLRLARFHLMDEVRGTPDMWRLSDVKRCKFTCKVQSLNQSSMILWIDGEYSMQNASGSRGHNGRFAGRLEIDTKQAVVTQFRGYAEGPAWGRGTYTPFPPPGKYQLHLAFHEASDPSSRVVPPEEVSTANNDLEYRNPISKLVEPTTKRRNHKG